MKVNATLGMACAAVDAPLARCVAAALDVRSRALEGNPPTHPMDMVGETKTAQTAELRARASRFRPLLVVLPLLVGSAMPSRRGRRAGGGLLAGPPAQASQTMPVDGTWASLHSRCSNYKEGPSESEQLLTAALEALLMLCRQDCDSVGPLAKHVKTGCSGSGYHDCIVSESN